MLLSRLGLGVIAGLAASLVGCVASRPHGGCTKDTDCAAGRVCNAGACESDDTSTSGDDTSTSSGDDPVSGQSSTGRDDCFLSGEDCESGNQCCEGGCNSDGECDPSLDDTGSGGSGGSDESSSASSGSGSLGGLMHPQCAGIASAICGPCGGVNVCGTGDCYSCALSLCDAAYSQCSAQLECLATCSGNCPQC